MDLSGSAQGARGVGSLLDNSATVVATYRFSTKPHFKLRGWFPAKLSGRYRENQVAQFGKKYSPTNAQ
ncbi:MAG: hypothetical protein ACPG32_14870 [Akkermansiaceae bacterium]